MDARLLDPIAEARVRARELLERLLEALIPHARALGCGAVLDAVHAMAHDPGERRQRRRRALPRSGRTHEVTGRRLHARRLALMSASGSETLLKGKLHGLDLGSPADRASIVAASANRTNGH